MKVLIWIHKDDVKKAVGGTILTTDEITKHHYQCPQVGYVNYVQVSISVDEFVRLEDKD